MRSRYAVGLLWADEVPPVLWGWKVQAVGGWCCYGRGAVWGAVGLFCGALRAGRIVCLLWARGAFCGLFPGLWERGAGYPPAGDSRPGQRGQEVS